MIAQNILELIGGTPVMELTRMKEPSMGRIVVKLEYLNPGGSIKSRTALAMIEDAERRGLLKEDSIIVEPSTGNQGIGLAMVCAVKGYKVKVIMPDSVSEERKKMIHHLGGEVVLIKDCGNIQDTVKACMSKAQQLQQDDSRVFLTRQFENPANPEIHYQITGAELIEQVDGNIDAFCGGFGTGGSLSGIGKRILEKYPQCRIVAAEPENAAILAGKMMGQHIQQGIGDGVIAPFMNLKMITGHIIVTDMQAVLTARELARKEGLLAGISSGTNVYAAMQVAKELGEGKTVVTILPDTAERYYSTALFE